MTTKPRPFITPARIKAPGASQAFAIICTVLGILLLLVGFAALPAAGFGALLLAIASGINFRNFIRTLSYNIEQRLIEMQIANGQVYKQSADDADEIDTNRRQFEG